MKVILRLVLVLLMVVTPTLSGCNKQEQQKPVPPPLSIGVSIVMDGFQEIMEPFKKEMHSLAKERKIRLVWKEAKDGAGQEKHFEELLEQKLGAILAFMPKIEEAKKLAQKAKEKEMKLMAVGVLPPNIPLDGFVGIDPNRVGEQQGKYLVDALKDNAKGRILILNTDSNNPTEQKLLTGNSAALQQDNSIQVIEQEMPRENIPLGLNKIWEQLGPIDGLITHEYKTTKAVLVSLAGQSFQPVLIGIGASKEAAEFIAGGEHTAEIDLEPEIMARYAFEAAYNLAKTGEWDFDNWVDNGAYQIPVKYSPSRVITRENISLLQPRHGNIQAKSPINQAEKDLQKGQEAAVKDESQSQEKNKENQGSKIKVKLKDGKELEFHVPGEIKGIEIEGKIAEGKKEEQGQGENGSSEGGSSQK